MTPEERRKVLQKQHNQDTKAGIGKTGHKTTAGFRRKRRAEHRIETAKYQQQRVKERDS